MPLPVIPEEVADSEEDATMMDMRTSLSNFWRPYLERILERPIASGFYEVVPKPELKPKFTCTARPATMTTTPPPPPQEPGELDMTACNLRTCRMLSREIVVVISELQKWIEAHVRIWTTFSLLHKGCHSIDAKLVQHLSTRWLEHDKAAQKLLEQVKAERDGWFEFKSRPGIAGRFQRMVCGPPDMGTLCNQASNEPARRFAQLNKAYVQMEALAAMVKKNVCALYILQAERYAAILDSKPDFFALEDAGQVGIDLERIKAVWDSRNEAIFRQRIEKMLRGRSDISITMWTIQTRS
ncbi:uncharacterized protein A1O5_10021 [Cladophialophora psammophila CBS 110553]|uniref:Uncharacterized protein n=1 Tax=Cladophialophora psammophila CBS 110553 TaxID=1182543 RepID=W9WQ83_9EURO|nr:uncharacterized protein A1O5_10021 [Cladophialophora psammophila CBS 110553]EXJ66826.1 hypothetical protein A1O5_10021 [Cladophialophora psammophila CBS 110553]